jgi:hypothetical protein
VSTPTTRSSMQRATRTRVVGAQTGLICDPRGDRSLSPFGRVHELRHLAPTWSHGHRYLRARPRCCFAPSGGCWHQEAATASEPTHVRRRRSRSPLRPTSCPRRVKRVSRAMDVPASGTADEGPPRLSQPGRSQDPSTRSFAQSAPGDVPDLFAAMTDPVLGHILELPALACADWRRSERSRVASARSRIIASWSTGAIGVALVSASLGRTRGTSRRRR